MAVDNVAGTASAARALEIRRRSASEGGAKDGEFTSALVEQLLQGIGSDAAAGNTAAAPPAIPTDTETLTQAIKVEKLVNWEQALERRIERFESLGDLRAERSDQQDLIASLKAVAKETTLTGEQRELLRETRADLAVTDHRIENFETLNTLKARQDVAEERFAALDSDALDAWKEVFHPTK